MTTAARNRPHRPTRGQRSPLAEHGTAARYIGRPGQGIPGCRCDACRNAKLKADGLRALANLSGHTVRVPAAPVADHIRGLLDAGMGWTRITRAAHCSTSTIQRLLGGQDLVRRTVADRILAVKYRPAPGRYVDGTGTRRRVQALMATGHTAVAIAAESGIDYSVIFDIIRGCPQVRGVTSDRIAAAYDWLSEQAPTGRKAAITTARNRAARERWAPPHAWDDDTLDDPQAHPEWTGCCGTDRGWWTHRLNDIPVCPPCQAAHEQWKAERAHLTPVERWTEVGKARAAASNRGATIAADARELLALNNPIDQVAARLGVTRQHLQQELCRHPQTEQELAA